MSTKDERIALVNADIAAGRVAVTPPTFTVSRRDKYKRGDVEAGDGWRLFRDGKGKL